MTDSISDSQNENSEEKSLIDNREEIKDELEHLVDLIPEDKKMIARVIAHKISVNAISPFWTFP